MSSFPRHRSVFPTLAPVAEDGSIGDVGDFEPISPPAMSRKRLESATSARFFPGAWVTSSPVIPERASLDVAQGEFSRPGTEPSSAAHSPSSENDEKKARCVIM